MARIDEPISIGRLKLRNRLAVAPTETMLASPKDGYVTDRLMDRYEELAFGGWGLICVEVAYVRIDGSLFRNKLSIATDFHVSGLSELAGIIKMGNSKASIQIMHGGRLALFSGHKWGFEAIAPSPVPFFGLEPREMTAKECEEMLDIFAICAERAKEAGFDAVTIHGANGFLPEQFMSPAFNKRTDKFGERMFWPTELAKRIKAATGNDFPLIWRLSADEYMGEKGITLKMTKNEIIPALEEAGVDCFDVTGGSLDSPHMIIPTSYQPRKCLIHLARGVKEVTKLPVIGVGNINLGEHAREVVKNESCDMISVSRAAIADPHFADKTLRKNDKEINSCIACYRCSELGFSQKVIKCSVNPRHGIERKARFGRKNKCKKVVVVGGGPAGMTVALEAADRGHKVVLFEKEMELGGQLLIACVPPGKEQIKHLTRYLIHKLEKSSVTVRTGEEADPVAIQSENADSVVVATGAKPFMPDFCCSDKEQLIAMPNVVTAFDILKGIRSVGQRVAVIGGDLVACETADYLSDKGKDVTIVRRGKEIGSSYGSVIKPLILERLKSKNVVMMTEVIYETVTDEGLVVIKDNKEQMIKAENIVVAAGLAAQRTLYDQLKNMPCERYLIGDADNPSDILYATSQAYSVAVSL